MGRGEYKILFAEEIPSFPAIQATFFAQTGLAIEFTVTIHIVNLHSKHSDVISLLAQDAEGVASLEKQKQLFYDAHPQQYEECARVRDTTKQALQKFNHASAVRLIIPDFYEIEFDVDGKLLTLVWYLDKRYGIFSLIKVLIDLGGQFMGDDGSRSSDYPQQWKELKKWHEYKWYNRPRK